jgi:hypothetical protein
MTATWQVFLEQALTVIAVLRPAVDGPGRTNTSLDCCWTNHSSSGWEFQPRLVAPKRGHLHDRRNERGYEISSVDRVPQRQAV